jgi:8-amino-7-oxononanoate synthase
VQISTNRIHDHASHVVNERKSTGRHRQRRQLHSPQGPEIQCGDRKLLNFCSNDYLGLANHAEINAALKKGVDQYGTGSGASHMICGHSVAHAQLEERVADFTGRQRALLFSTGYMANLAIVTALLGRGDSVYADRLNHASMIDAACLSRAELKRFPHCDYKTLTELIKQSSAEKKLVLSDGVFSMDGDIASIPDLVTACKEEGAWLGIDDAHGFGVLGKKGGGTLEHYNVTVEDVPILMATFGKALGCFGAFVAGDDVVIEALMQNARSYIYTTAPPPALAVATIRSLELLEEENWRREHLQNLIERFRKNVIQTDLPVSESVTPVQPLIIGSDKKALQISQALLEQGILVSAIRPPTVPEGTARLRITLSAAHTEDQLDYLMDMLIQAYGSDHDE